MTTIRRLTPALMIVATLAAVFAAAGAEAAEPATKVVTLPRVEVIASRQAMLAEPRIVELPTVMVVGKRSRSQEPTRLAQKAAAAAPRS